MAEGTLAGSLAVRQVWVEMKLLSPLLAVTARGVCFVSLTPARAQRDLRRWVERQRPDGEADGALLQRAAEQLREVADGDTRCWQVHDVAVAADGTIYAGENDNPYRSGYLWEIAL